MVHFMSGLHIVDNSNDYSSVNLPFDLGRILNGFLYIPPPHKLSFITIRRWS